MISEGCILNGIHAQNSIIGLRSRIDNGTHIENSIVMGSDFFESIDDLKKNVAANIPHVGIGKNSIIRRAIIDKNVRIGNNVRLVNQHNVETADSDNGCWFIRDGIIIVPKGAIIPDGTEV